MQAFEQDSKYFTDADEEMVRHVSRGGLGRQLDWYPMVRGYD